MWVAGTLIIGIIGIAIMANSQHQTPAKVITLKPTPTEQITPTLAESATISGLMSSTTPAAPQTATTPTVGIVQNAAQAVIHSVKGDITIKLYPQDAPKTVANFATLSERGYYNNLTFHRVEAGFVIQGGDPNGNGTGGTSIYGPTFEDELNPNTPSYKEGYKAGVVAMANRGSNTNGSQFFIMLADTPLPHQYTIFGKVTSGMDVAQKIQVGDKMTSIDITTQ